MHSWNHHHHCGESEAERRRAMAGGFRRAFLVLLFMGWAVYTIMDFWNNASEPTIQIPPVQVMGKVMFQIEKPSKKEISSETPEAAKGVEHSRSPNLILDCSKEQQLKGSVQGAHMLSPLSTNEKFLIPYLQKHGFQVQESLGVRREVVDLRFEPSLLCSPPLDNPKLLPNEMSSKVTVVNPKSSYQVGDKIQLRVDLYDGRGKMRTSGGDEVRMWLKSAPGTPGQKDYDSVAVRVVDLRNGSYAGYAQLKWPGVASVYASLTYPSEFMRSLVLLRHTLHSLHWVTGIFINRTNNVKETTVCLQSPPIPGYATACNLTAYNGGSPWFCGRPRNRDLDCEQWTLTGNLDFLLPLPLDEVSRNMVSRIDRPPFIKLIPNDLKILTKLSSQHVDDLPPCWSRPRLESWTGHTPRGWIQGGAWLAQNCSLPYITRDYARICLQNTGLLLLGDSNQGLFFNSIRGLMKGYVTDCDRAVQSVKYCQMAAINSTLIFIPHSKPFNVGNHPSQMLSTQSLQQSIQQLLSLNHTRNVVVVHYYVHNSFYPVHSYRVRAQYARGVIEKALQSNPDLKVIIRGPHVIYRGKQNHANFGDNFGPWYTQIWREEFRGLHDKVWFLDLWDLSIAMENLTSHPPDDIVLEMVKALFGYFCEL